VAVVTMKSLLESGVHFGHQVRRWDPRMKKYIFAERNGIHIIDLQKTVIAIREAYDAIRRIVAEGKSVLFVGTKKQAQAIIQKEAERCGMFYVNNRWLGGMLTNFSTIKKSLARLKKIEKMEVDGTFENLTKKEVATLQKEKTKLEIEGTPAADLVDMAPNADALQRERNSITECFRQELRNRLEQKLHRAGSSSAD